MKIETTVVLFFLSCPPPTDPTRKEKLATKPHFVIFDSINGLYNTLSNDADSGRVVNAILMLLVRNVTFSNSILIISALAGKKENNWILPNGRQILENDKMKKFIISDRSKIIIEN